MTARSTRTLLAGLIDYAGTFPPAALGMDDAVLGYARLLRGEHAWMLGRFVCRVTRLPEFSEAAAALLPGTYATSGYREMARQGDPWRLAAVVDTTLERALEQIERFNVRHAAEDAGLARVDVVEMRAAAPDEVDLAMEHLPQDLYPVFEVPTARDVRGFLAAIAGYQDQGGAAAKIRCGGLTPETIPPVEQVATFIFHCAAAGVPFKATAGLHHPVRSQRPLTDEPGAPRAMMHGFINVFVAAGLARAERLPLADLTAIVAETDPAAFQFTDEFVRWQGRVLETARLARARETFALSFGSCSFDEPVQGLRELGLL